jgi:hypothetical protein
VFDIGCRLLREEILKHENTPVAGDDDLGIARVTNELAGRCTLDAMSVRPSLRMPHILSGVDLARRWL